MDSQRNKYAEKLIDLYGQKSKHSNYQILPKALEKILDFSDVKVKSRYEKERFDYISSVIEIKDKTVLDIGGNTGFFTFAEIEEGAKEVYYVEGNKAHTEFVELSARALDILDKVNISNAYYDFYNDKNHYDVCFLLNVLHHLGGDYGDNSISIIRAKELMIEQLNRISCRATTAVFQLGFNWKGNRELCLFENGTKKELIEFVQKGVEGRWSIRKIAVAERYQQTIKYVPIDDVNIKRDDSLGEFLNRPIFILDRKGAL